MPLQTIANSEAFKFLERNRGMLAPIGAMSLILVILIPLPTALMDLLLVVNITLATIVLMTVMYTDKPLNFSSKRLFSLSWEAPRINHQSLRRILGFR